MAARPPAGDTYSDFCSFYGIPPDEVPRRLTEPMLLRMLYDLPRLQEAREERLAKRQAYETISLLAKALGGGRDGGGGGGRRASRRR